MNGEEHRKPEKANKLVLYCQIADHKSQMISLGIEHSPQRPNWLTYGVSRLTVLSKK